MPKEQAPTAPWGTAGATPAQAQTPPGCRGSSEDAWPPKRATRGQLAVCTVSQRIADTSGQLPLLKLKLLPLTCARAARLEGSLAAALILGCDIIIFIFSFQQTGLKAAIASTELKGGSSQPERPGWDRPRPPTTCHAGRQLIHSCSQDKGCRRVRTKPDAAAP